MAIDIYSENMVNIISPTRISFSHDLHQDDDNQIDKNPRLDQNQLDSSSFDFDFDFAFDLNPTTFIQSSLSTADELFSNGKILPTQIKKEESPNCTQKKSLREFLEDSIEETEPNISSIKSFWKFKRSNSEKKRIIGSWKILSRSGSTGKFLQKIVEEDDEDETEKPAMNVKSFWKFGRSNSLNSAPIGNNNSRNVELRRSSSLNCAISGANQGLIGKLSRSKSAPNQKGQIGKMKSYKSMGVTPILNLPSPYISRLNVDLFGFGSLFCNGSRDRKKNK